VVAEVSREIRYWQEVGLARGIEFYRRYLDLFGLPTDFCAGRAVCDYGCGPFGGVLSVLKGVALAYPVDVLAATYNGWHRCPMPIYGVNGSGRADVPDGSCDVAFCLNALDHVRDPSILVADLHRILKPGGLFYLFVHLRTGAKGHFPMTFPQTMSLLAGWEIPWATTGRDVPNEEPDLDALWLKAVRL